MNVDMKSISETVEITGLIGARTLINGFISVHGNQKYAKQAQGH
jgi:hypothetical protein